MSVLKINCSDQVMQFTNTPVIASGGIREDHIEFTFCSQWGGFEKVAVFVKNTEMLPPELIDSTGRCEIPYDVLASAGRFYIGVFGVNAEGVRRTSEFLEYSIREGAVCSVEGLEDPDLLDQILAALAGKQDPLAWDLVPTQDSTNAISSGAVYLALQEYVRQAALPESVPPTRTVNGQALVDDIELSASDVGAAPASHVNDTAAHTTSEDRAKWDAATIDTGWVELTLGDGVTAQEGAAPQYRRTGNVVFLRGMVNIAACTGGMTVVSGIPTECAAGMHYWLAAVEGSRLARCKTAADGAITLDWVFPIEATYTYADGALDISYAQHTEGAWMCLDTSYCLG